MSINRTFGNAAKPTSTDVMLAYGQGYGELEPDKNFQQGNNVPNPIFEEDGNADTFMQDTAAKSDLDGTLTQTLLPGRSYEARVNTDLKRNPNEAIYDGKNVAKQAASGKEEVHKQKGAFKEEFKGIKAEATEALKEAAAEMDDDPSVAEDQMVAKGETSNLGMLVGAGAGVFMGGVGVGAAAVNGVIQELSKKDQQLPVETQRAILADNLKILQASRKPLDSREEASSHGKMDVTSAKNSPRQSEYAWENMTKEGLAELHQADPEGKDQKEYLDLDRIDNELDEVIASHGHAQRHYGDVVTVAKVEQAVSSGNGAMEQMQANAQEVVAFDGAHAGLVGDSVAGIGGSVVASNPDLDTSSLATHMNMDKLDPAAANKLDAGMGMHA